jgi:hypothetical protein
MNVTAFGKVDLPFGARPKAIFGSDIGHWDVTHMNGVPADANDFRDLTFTNPARLHAEMNPNFFKGTVVEDTVDKLLALSSGA